MQAGDTYVAIHAPMTVTAPILPRCCMRRPQGDVTSSNKANNDAGEPAVLSVCVRPLAHSHTCVHVCMCLLVSRGAKPVSFSLFRNFIVCWCAMYLTCVYFVFSLLSALCVCSCMYVFLSLMLLYVSVFLSVYVTCAWILVSKGLVTNYIFFLFR